MGDDDDRDGLPDVSGSDPPPRRRVVRPGVPQWDTPATLAALRGFSEAVPRAVGALEARSDEHHSDIETLRTDLAALSTDVSAMRADFTQDRRERRLVTLIAVLLGIAGALLAAYAPDVAKTILGAVKVVK